MPKIVRKGVCRQDSVSLQHCSLANSKEIVHTQAAGRGRTNQVKSRRRTRQPRHTTNGLRTTIWFMVYKPKVLQLEHFTKQDLASMSSTGYIILSITFPAVLP